MGTGASGTWRAEVLERIRDAERRGELLLAVDLADQALLQWPGDVALQHRAALAVARTGATESAVRRFADGALAQSDDPEIRALGARIAKDLALRADDDERKRLARAAAARYAAVGGSYATVNAATLSTIAGDLDAAHAYARSVLELVAAEPASYYRHATEAEALLVLARPREATEALARAAAMAEDRAATASTARQLELLCTATGADTALLDHLRGPAVLHFCGHMPGGPRFPVDDEGAVVARIAAELDRTPVGAGYGALAAGGDVLVAEALLARGAELHVVLPVAPERFFAVSVAPAGPAWVDRAQRCLDAARSVTTVSPEAEDLDDALLRHGTDLAMGLALLRARWLRSDAHQLAVWDGRSSDSIAGTAADVARWRDRGGTTAVVRPPTAAPPRSIQVPGPGRRQVLALLFADVKGYSTLADEALPRFNEVVLAALAAVLDRHEACTVSRNTWGDGLHVGVEGVEPAARIALELQEAVAELDETAPGQPPGPYLRLGAHVGPVYLVHDPVRGVPGVAGVHVNRAARLEPVTPPGEVFVTEAFAAALELAGVEDLACDYVGHLPGAKDIGRMRMHRLRRAP